MILLWLKINWHKIHNRLTRAVPGTEPRVPARATGAETSPEVSTPLVAIDPSSPDGLVLYGRQAGKVITGQAKLQELIDKGLVYAPDTNGDLYRVSRFEQDKLMREESGLPERCPCGGRHFPSAAACRWCTCHDPNRWHHGPCLQCGSPHHPVGMHLPLDDVPGLAADHTARQLLHENLIHDIEMSYRPCKICRAVDHAGAVHDEIMAVRPSAEIVRCGWCGHADHGGVGSPCPGSVPSWEPSGGIERCRCGQTDNPEDGHA